MAVNKMKIRERCKIPAFNGVIREVPDISVDYFENLNATTYFLSHCHADHIFGLSSPEFHQHIKQNKNYIYCTALTKCILEKTHFEDISERVLVLNVGPSSMITVPSKDNPDKEAQLCVTLVPTGHCPGAVMFLFETNGAESPILYTGDFRLCKTDVAKLSQLHQKCGIPRPIYKMYLDATFADKKHVKFPLRKESIDAVCSVINYYYDDKENKPKLFCIEKPARFGSEALLVEIAKRFGTKIHVDEAAYWIYMQIPEISSYVTNDPESTRIHSCLARYKINYEKACLLQCRNGWFKSKVIRPACMWYDSNQYDGTLESIIREEMNKVLIRICYASHCSREELEYFVKYLKPRKMEPIAFPESMSKEQLMEWFVEIVDHNNDNHLELLSEEPDPKTAEGSNDYEDSSPETITIRQRKTASVQPVSGNKELQREAVNYDNTSFIEIQNLVSRDLASGSDDKELLDELASEIKQLQSPSCNESLSADLLGMPCAVGSRKGTRELGTRKVLSVIATDSSYSERPQFDEKPFPKRTRKMKPLGKEVSDSALEFFMSTPEIKRTKNLEVGAGHPSNNAHGDEKEIIDLCTGVNKMP